jgi:hypothetical protein
MTDPTPDHSKNPRNVNHAAFARFLAFLSSDQEEASRLYMRLHEKLTGFFKLKGTSDPVSAADETIDRAILKIDAGAPVPDAGKYCMGIARNLALEKFRHTEREHTAFQSFIENLPNGADEQVERIYEILKPCFELLAPDDQQLLMGYCQVMQGRARSEHRRQLAEAMMTTVLALRMRVTRLRGSLADCVRQRSRAGK